MWSVQQHGGKYPTEHPDGWNAQMMYYNDGVPIKAEAVVDLLKQMPYANNFALAVQDIRDQQAISEADRKEREAISVPELLSPTSPIHEPSSPTHYAQQQQPMVQMQQGSQLQQQQQQMQPMMMMPQQQQQMQPMMMMPHPMMMMPQPMMVPHPTMMMQPTQPTSATGANAAELIEAQLHPSTTSDSTASSMLDVAPEVKAAESSSASSESSGGSSEGKRVIKLS
jgi:hypothetical protein